MLFRSVADTWYHIVCTWDGSSTSNIYLNAIKNAPADDGSPTAISYNATTLNKIGDYNGYEIDGQMSNVAFWDTELSQANVDTLYNNGTPWLGTQPQAANLKGWWKLDGSDTWNGVSDEWNIFNNALPIPTPTYTTALANDNTSTSISTGGVTPASLDYAVFSLWYKSEDPTVWPSSKYLINNNLYSLKVRNDIITVITNHSSVYKNWTCPVHDGNWHNIILHFPNIGSAVNLADITLLFDGVEPTNTIAGWGNVGLLTTINGIFGVGTSPHPSQLSNFSFWNTNIINATNIATIWNNGTPGDISSLSPYLWWKINNTASASSTDGLYDNGSGGNNGALTGSWTQSTTDIIARQYGLSDGMTTANLVTSNLTRSIPYSSYSMYFDGANDFIDCGATTLGAAETNVSASIWFKNDDNVEQSLFSVNVAAYAYGRFAIWKGVGGANLAFYLNGASVRHVTTTTGEWQHVVVTYDGGAGSQVAGQKIYLNGVNVSDTHIGTMPTSLDFTTTNVRIAKVDNSVSYEFGGNLSNAALWNSTLTEDQILSIYNGGVPNDISSLSPIGWWSLAGDSYYDGTDWICPDLSTNSNNGTSDNMGGTELVGDGPGSTANGEATSMNIPANLKGDAPSSTNNAFSVNMDTQSRVAI